MYETNFRRERIGEKLWSLLARSLELKKRMGRLCEGTWPKMCHGLFMSEVTAKKKQAGGHLAKVLNRV